MAAPVKKSNVLLHRKSENSENSNPNIRVSTPGRKSTPHYSNSSKKTVKSLKSLISPCSTQQNKFIVKKKLSLKESKASNSKNQSKAPVLMKIPIKARLSSPIDLNRSEKRQIRKSKIRFSEIGIKNRDLRSKIIEGGLNDAPEPGQGRVRYLVKEFEKLCLKKEEERVKKEKREFKSVLSEIGNLQKKPDETEISYSGSGGSTSAERCVNEKSDVDSGEQFERISKRESNASSGSNKTKRNSTESTGRNFAKKPKVTNPHPFTLKTEERGRVKEESFMQKMKKKLLEEERLRIPLAQGLPLTTEKPHYLLKPKIKVPTEPIDLILHTDIRAVERAEFDHQVAEKINFVENLKMERERQLKIEEEIEIKRLRRELVPKAQPMPYFDKPFIPKRSILPRTVPKEPKFHARPPRHSKS
ncbi:hypothetical protein LUZ60_004909 [Juncus effusus]|nr:hypothetical protein LUZ60_004909 [Juncus effusus]